MTTPSARLDAIGARCDAATPAPWVWDDYVDPAGDEILGDLRAPNMDVNGPTSGGYHPAVIVTDMGVYPPRGPDRAFIARGREDLPWAVGRLLEARRLLRGLFGCLPPTRRAEIDAFLYALDAETDPPAPSPPGAP